MVRLITPLILILPALIFADPPEDDLSAGSASSGPLYSNRSLQDQDEFLNRKRIRDTIIQALALATPTSSSSYVPTYYPTISNYPSTSPSISPSTSPSTSHSPSSSPSISQLPTVSTIPSAKPTMTAKGGNNFVDGSKVGKVGKGDKASKTSTNDDGSGGNSFVDGSKSSKTYSNDEEEDDDI
eukprot:scaffold3197_cov21-Cyclotella_meneghiniana.AAC.1